MLAEAYLYCTQVSGAEELNNTLLKTEPQEKNNTTL
jgi:hypothetical protein